MQVVVEPKIEPQLKQTMIANFSNKIPFLQKRYCHSEYQYTLWETTFPGSVVSILPPASAAKSTVTEPDNCNSQQINKVNDRHIERIIPPSI